MTERAKRRQAIHDAVLDREASEFAMALLMPAKWLREDVKRTCAGGVVDDADVSRLARRYQVSQVAMTNRLRDLGIGFRP